MENKYNNGKIYKIVCDDTNKVYIGSTCEPTLSERLSKHKCGYKRWLKDGKLYVTSYEILQGSKYHIELIELFQCNTRAELRRREGQIQLENDCINKRIAGRTRAEAQIVRRKRDYGVKDREYYQRNKDKIAEKGKLKSEAKKIYMKQYYAKKKLEKDCLSAENNLVIH